jgi:hypothetical protein
MLVQISLLSLKNTGQMRINNGISWIMNNHSAVQWHEPIIQELDAFMANNTTEDIATTSYKSASIERQPFLILHPA